MLFDYLDDWIRIVLAVVCSFVISYFLVPPVKKFAESVGAIDEPGKRRIHDHPIPRMGGLAIVIAFLISALLFTQITQQVRGIMIGVIMIALMGALDDIYDLNAWIKLAVQIAAALVAIFSGVVLNGITNPFMQDGGYGFTQVIGNNLGIILTLGWIIICTNAMNLIDGLDGLAVGLTAIGALTMLVVSLLVSDVNVTVILACLLGGCIGFMPYNLNPAKIFMGDVGSQSLGFILGTASTLGLFKLHALVTFLVPIMALAVPLADTTFAFFRRIAKGQSPFKADKGHFHHKLLALGLSQRQVVAILWAITGITGLISILMTESGAMLKIICAVLVFAIATGLWIFVLQKMPVHKYSETEPDVKIYDKGAEK